MLYGKLSLTWRIFFSGFNIIDRVPAKQKTNTQIFFSKMHIICANTNYWFYLLIFAIHYIALYQSADDRVSATYTCKLTIRFFFPLFSYLSES